MWEFMADDSKESDKEKAQAKVQELLTQAIGLLNQAKELASTNDLSFWFLGTYWSPVEDKTPWDEDDVQVDEWESSWSPGC
jgi:hypothetical protein